MALHRAASALRGVVTAITGSTSQSTFSENGLLTHEEFECAGDHLVKYFTSWAWHPAQKPHLADPCLPPNKQYLVITQCTSRHRIDDMDRALRETVDGDAIIITKAEGDGDDRGGEGEESKATRGEGEESQATGGTPRGEGARGDDLIEDDEARVIAPPDADDPTGSDIRSYTLRITYNKFFRMPSLWVGGFNSLQEPLTQNEIFEDVGREYRAKTITLVKFPFAENLFLLEIHPCNHGNIMNRVVTGWKRLGWDPNTDPRVHLALLVFLKMLSSVIPTISYDFTITVNMLGLLDIGPDGDDSLASVDGSDEDDTESNG